MSRHDFYLPQYMSNNEIIPGPHSNLATRNRSHSLAFDCTTKKVSHKGNKTLSQEKQSSSQALTSVTLNFDQPVNIHTERHKLGISDDYVDMRNLTYECEACKARLWHDEAARGNKNLSKKSYSLCCMRGKVMLPNIRDPPDNMYKLFTGKDERSKDFIKNIRKYNSMFSFTSIGGKIDNRYNRGGGPYTYRMHGENYHSIGSLLPKSGQIPKFSQLYIYDTDHEATNRFNAFSSSHDDPTSNPTTMQFQTIHKLQQLLDVNNPLVKQFRMVRDRLNLQGENKVQLKLIGRRNKDGRTYNLPTADEVAALIIGDFDGSGDKRDILLEKCSGQLQRISELHPSYLALQYPLLFPYGEDGYRVDIFLKDVNNPDQPGRTNLSMREFFAYRLQQRLNEKSLLLMSRKLLQQFLVDAFTMVENQRLYYIKTHQKTLRLSTDTNLSKALADGQVDSSLIGNRVILPSSFTGGTRYMQQNFLDAMALCKWYGYPDLFITITCNPKWPELCRVLEILGLHASDRAYFLTTLYKLKLDHLINAIKDEHILGRVNAVVYTIEFQKRGLPHAHICLFFHKEDKLPNPEDIDRIICAELPNKEKDPDLFQLVSEFMIHGPCGEQNPTCPFTDITVEKSGVELDNRHVVGYNFTLLKRYQSHINIEWCNQLGSIKYLFKYINKGPDRITIGFSQTNKHSSNLENDNEQGQDEVKNYFDCRYVSACEASWRLFGFEIHYQTPHVERLSFHLENEQPILYDPEVNVDDILEKAFVGKSQFTQWMECNKTNQRARQLTYVEFPQYFVWNSRTREWTERKKGKALGRLPYVPPKAGESFYLRILLNKVRGPTSYKQIKTINFMYDTFRDACYALGLLDDDKEYIECIEEMSRWASASSCRSLFVMLITSDTLTRPDCVWEHTWQYLSDDILHIRRKELQIPDLDLDEDAIKNIALAKIEGLLRGYAMSLKNIPNMPYPYFNYIEDSCNMLLQEELSYDKACLKEEHDHLFSLMTDEQKNIYTKITDAVHDGEGSVFFVYGYGGTCKTFLWKTISAGLRSEGRIVLNVASSEIASLLLSGGRTAHSRFAIPIDIHEDSFCNVSSDSHLAGLLRKADIIIWDEAPMMHRHCFEAFDRTLKDKVHPAFSKLPFGGKVMVFGGDFRQILPVIPKGRREDIVNASLNSSYLWEYCTVLNLTVNMRLQTGSNDQDIETLKDFADWILDIGEGNLGGDNDGEAEITFPQDVLINTDGDHVRSITDAIYPSINDHLYDQNYFQDRAVLVPTNDEVEYINEYMLFKINNEETTYLSSDTKINNEETTYLSSDTICSAELSTTFEESLYSPEILNSFKVSGIPHHKLSLKIGVPVMLLRNINQSNGLCNETRLQVIRLGNHAIESKILSGKYAGNIRQIPRMKITPSDPQVPVKFQRRQFPIMLCFAMTINKSQGQYLSNVGLFIRKPVFSHGQLYVAVSRVKSKKGLKVLICDNNDNPTDKTTNVVYKEVLHKIYF